MPPDTKLDAQIQEIPLKRNMAPSETSNAFTPISPNPFITGNPVRDPSLFFGREDDFAHVRQRLIAESEGIVMLFVGERRSGKTSIMFQILDGRLGDEFLPIFIDMQQIAGVVGDNDLLGRIAEFTIEQIDDKRLVAEYYDFAQGNPVLTFDRLLDDIHQIFPDKRLVFLVDEAEILQTKEVREEITNAALMYLSNILESRKVSFCFTGSSGLADSGSVGWRRLISKGEAREITFLSKTDTLRLIQHPVEGRVFYGEGVVDSIYDLTFGHPFYTQVICTNVVDYLNEAQKNDLDIKGLQDVVRTIIDNPPPQLVYAWDEFSITEQLCLSLLSEESDKGVLVKPQALFETIKENNYPLQLKSDALHKSLEDLYGHKVLERSDEGGYHFRVDLFRQWIRRARSIWSLVEEQAPRKGRRVIWAAAGVAAFVLAAGLGYIFSRSTETSVQGGGPAAIHSGNMWVESDLREVEVVVNGELRGTRAPVMISDLEPGSYIVEVKKPKYYSWTREVAIEKGKTDSLHATLLRQTGILNVRSQPAGVLVQVEGEVDTSAITPLENLALPTGVYQVTMRQSGYVEQRRQVNIAEGAAAEVTFELRVRVGNIYVDSRSRGALILVDGKSTGSRTPSLLESRSVGRHKIALRLPDHESSETQIEVALGRTDTVRLNLVLSPARLQLTSIPPGANIFIDGNARGQTPKAMELKPGQHRIQLIKEGYESHESEQNYQPGQSYRPRVVLVAQYGWVRIVKPLFGTLMVNGTDEHTVPPGDIQLQVGTYTVAAKGQKEPTTVHVTKGDTVKVSLP